jgi:hypothetical protein
LELALRRMWSTPARQRRSGKHLVALTRLIARCLSEVVDRGGSVRFNPELQGWYRDRKRWDVAVLDAHGHLVAAIELKSLLTAYYKNLNNRLEEALGSSVDFETLRELRFEGDRRVWTAYVLVLAETRESRRVRKTPPLVPPVAPRDFAGLDGIETARLACKRLVLTRRYDRVAAIVTRRPSRGAPALVDKRCREAIASLLNALVVHAIRALDS